MTATTPFLTTLVLGANGKTGSLRPTVATGVWDAAVPTMDQELR